MAKIIKSYKKLGHEEMKAKTVELAKTPMDNKYFEELVKSLMDKDIMKESSEEPRVYIYT